jgi:adenylate cyclase class IV
MQEGAGVRLSVSGSHCQHMLSRAILIEVNKKNKLGWVLVMKEIEKRVFLTNEQYKSLLVEFKVQSKQPERQVTTYYSTKDKNSKDIDLRLMRTVEYAKLWVKRGKIHDVHREEFEVRIDLKYAFETSKILELLFESRIKWFRERIETKYKKASICIDKNINYDAIFEIEILVSPDEEIEKSENLLNVYLRELGLKETTKKLQNKKYKDYVSNWSKLEFPNDEIQWLHKRDNTK